LVGVVVVGTIGCNSHRPVVPEVDERCEDRSIEYADEVRDYDPELGGFDGPSTDKFGDPEDALGSPDYTGGHLGTGAVAVGRGGMLQLDFAECELSTSGDADTDLRVFEVGPYLEEVAVFLEPNAPDAIDPDLQAFEDFFYVGTVVGGEAESIDVDAALGLDQPHVFTAVALVDLTLMGSDEGLSPGADVDAVEFYYPVTP
jgi:hypothetical protein